MKKERQKERKKERQKERATTECRKTAGKNHADTVKANNYERKKAKKKKKLKKEKQWARITQIQ